MTSYMTTKKAQDILLEDKRKQAEKNSNKVLNATAFTYRNSNNKGQEAGGCRHCYKPGYKENLCQRKHLELIRAWAKLKRKSKSIPNKSTLPAKPAIMRKNVNCQAKIQDIIKLDLKQQAG